jgi:predicted transcriptional regulator
MTISFSTADPNLPSRVSALARALALTRGRVYDLAIADLERKTFPPSNKKPPR